jgi:hypothetical protein
MTTIVLVGDVGGCATQLAEAVAPYVDDPDAVVIQVGDLVDRGPDSSAVLAYVGARLPGGRWVQLVGNHDAQYVGGERFWPETLPDTDAEVLRSWWLRDRMHVAAAIRTAEGEELLVTHAGLSAEIWQTLGEPVTASTAAELLNTRPSWLWGYRGPLWAEAGSDVYPSWLSPGRFMPYSQVHGHSTIVDFRHRSWRCGERIRQRSTVDWELRHTVTRAAGGRLIAIDPKHGRAGAARWAPLVLHEAELLVP